MGFSKLTPSGQCQADKWLGTQKMATPSTWDGEGLPKLGWGQAEKYLMSAVQSEVLARNVSAAQIRVASEFALGEIRHEPIIMGLCESFLLAGADPGADFFDWRGKTKPLSPARRSHIQIASLSLANATDDVKKTLGLIRFGKREVVIQRAVNKGLGVIGKGDRLLELLEEIREFPPPSLVETSGGCQQLSKSRP